MRFLAFLALLFRPAPDEADLLLRGATIYDGSGSGGFVGDVALSGDRIVAVGEWKGEARRAIDAAGLVAAPGFIDLHTHSDDTILLKGTRDNGNYTTQGCATVVTGNCGGGNLDVGAMLRAIDREGAGTNVIHLVPLNAVRRRVFGSQDRPPTGEELDRMKALVEKGMKEGAWGVSTGLIYVPGTYTKTDEIVALAKVAHEYGGIYATHLRSEAGKLLEAIREAIEIGEKSGCPVQISHLKCSTKEAWGKMGEACALVEEARARGLKVAADQYPYAASSTGLESYTLPAWAREGGDKKLAERLDDPEAGAKIRREIAEGFERRDGADKLMIASYPKNAAYNGKTLAEIARAEGRDPVEVVVEIVRHGGAQAIGFSMREEDVLAAMKKDWVATGSDGGARTIVASVRPHPRNFGTFPRKIGRYAIEKGEIPVAFAIRSATGLPAEILGLKDRGLLKAGYRADVVLFDPADFRDRATFEDPNHYSTGVRWLFVNGVAVIAEGKRTGALPGRALRRPGP
jgi:N-acyl-D-aspartate/D-glutamate deacylase